MKKSQVLAALALAFALGLGVVAPVANTYAVAQRSAGQLGTTATTSATTTQLQNAINYVKALPQYNAYKLLADAVKNADDDGNGNVDSIPEPAAAQAALTTQYTAFGISYGSTDDLAALINKANSFPNFSAWKKLVNDFAKLGSSSSNHDTDAATLKADLAAVDSTYKFQNTDPDNQDDYAQVVADINNLSIANPLKNNTGATVTTLKESTVKILVTAYDNAVASNEAVTALKTALNGIAKASEIKTESAKSNPIASLIALAGTYTAAGTDGATYAVLRADVASAEAALKNPNSESDDDRYTNYVTDMVTEINKLEGYDEVTAATIMGSATGGNNQGTNKTTTLTFAAQGTTVTVTGEFEEGVTLKVTNASNKEVEAFKGHKYEMFDITLMKGDKKYEFDGKAIVTIKFSEVDGSKAGVYYVDEEGKASFMKGAEIKGDLATFQTTHFSLYAIVEDAAVALPNTGVISAAVEGNASTTVAMVAGIATALTAAGAGVVAYRNARRSVRK